MFRGSSFSFVVFGSGLLVKVWFVFIVLVLEVTPRIASMLHVFSSIIHGKTSKCLEGYTRKNYFLSLLRRHTQKSSTLERVGDVIEFAVLSGSVEGGT